MNPIILKATVKERPIMFSGPMVRAILDNRKTQTRRAVKPQPANCADLPMGKDLTISSACPFGEPGDRLWVRETFSPHPESNGQFIYRADRGGDYQGAAQGLFKWRPSIFMPRRASRLTLEVVSVRVERLQDITEEDAESEGADLWFDGLHPDHPERPSSVSAFHQLWDSINAKKHPWKSNPWVWVIGFKKL